MFAIVSVLPGCGSGDPLVSETSAAQSTGTSETTGTGGSSDTTADSSSSGGGSSTGSVCGELPLCDLCPDEMQLLCDQPCPEGAAPCSNSIGDGMTCESGLWACSVHPPLGPGCNEMCALMDACSEAGCSSGVTLSLEAADDVLPAGSYGVALDLDGSSEDCSFTVSEDPGACAMPPCVTDSTCNAQYLLTEHPQRVELTLGVIVQLGVSVTRDGTEIASQQFAPTYEIVAPNGPGCGPNCAAAAVSLPLP